MSFNEKVWALCARVPRGKVTTYGEIAHKLG
ncbi:MAG: MGMT family protein, partial [Anaerolineales bacterium]